MRNKNLILAEYNEYKAKGLKLDMSRGKPASDQLDISENLLKVVTKNSDCITKDGIDCRNYGFIDGIPEAKQLFSEMLGVNESEIIIGGNSSLNLMYDTISRALTHGLGEGSKPWSKYDKISFLCPVPGYDRHFGICEYFGINMINIPMKSDGPDMDMIEELVSSDETIKGCWCVPKYSNPTGITFSDEVVSRFARLKPKAKDFRVFWDNAYIIHDIYEQPDSLKEIFSEAKKYGNEDMFYEFASTSKITYAGAGISCIASSRRNIENILGGLKFQIISYDKLNQLRHAKVFKSYTSLAEQMHKQMELIRPKFDIVFRVFEEKLGNIAGISWTKPKGGYFLSLFLPENTAKRVVALARDAGLVVTPAGAPFPYGKDPDDSVIRIAPTFPTVAELETAAYLLCCCIELALAEG